MKIGILGAGQLCRMMILAGMPLGLQFKVFAPDGEHCIPHLGELTLGHWDDEAKLLAFAQGCDVMTYESENIPPTVVEALLKVCPVHPSLEALSQSQDRWLEKSLFQSLNIPTAPYQKVDTMADLKQFIRDVDYPVIVKKRRLGYDGKGQWRINNAQDLAVLTSDQLQDCIVEHVVNFSREVSVIAVRSSQGEIGFYDLCQNVHHQGILHSTRNKSNDPMEAKAYGHMKALLEHLNYVGCAALEMFEVKGTLIANEMAPRVHNSGHWTIEGAYVSQFENHLRAIAGLPLGSCQSRGSFEMINILGEFPDKFPLLQAGKHVHDYGKAFKPNRKRGHVTYEL